MLWASSRLVTITTKTLLQLMLKYVHLHDTGKHHQSTSGGGHPNHSGAIAGAVLGGIAAVVLVIVAACAFAHTRRRRLGSVTWFLSAIAVLHASLGNVSDREKMVPCGLHGSVLLSRRAHMCPKRSMLLLSGGRVHGPVSFQKYKDDDGGLGMRDSAYYAGSHAISHKSGELEMHHSGVSGTRTKSGTSSQGEQPSSLESRLPDSNFTQRLVRRPEPLHITGNGPVCRHQATEWRRWCCWCQDPQLKLCLRDSPGYAGSSCLLVLFVL